MPLGVSVPAGLVGVVALLLVEAPLPAADAGARFGLLVAGVYLFAAAVGDPVAALLVSGGAWLFYDGFVVGAFGELSWHGPADLGRAAVLLLSAVAATGSGHLRRRRTVLRGLAELEAFVRRQRPSAAMPPAGDRPATGPVQPHVAFHGED
jgi:hypothetical protein